MEDTNVPENIIPKNETTFVPEKPDLAWVDATTSTLTDSQKQKKKLPAYLWAILAVLVLAGLGGLGYYLSTLQREKDSADDFVQEQEEEDICESLDKTYTEAGNLLEIEYSSEVFSDIEMIDAVNGILGLKLVNSEDYLYLESVYETDELLTEESKQNVLERIYTCNDRVGYIVELSDGLERVVIRQETLNMGDQLVTEGFNKEYHFYCSENVDDCRGLFETISINFGDTKESISKSDLEIDTSDWESWIGEYISAELPEGWSAVEEMNTQDLTGFTRFLVKDEDGNNIFELTFLPAFGMGGPCSCTVYRVFSDSDLTSYYELEEYYESDEMEDFECSLEKKIITDYSEFMMLGHRIRRVGTIYYIDSNTEDSFFDGQCDVLGFSIFNMTDPVTGYSLGYKQNNYLNQDEVSPDKQYTLTLLSDESTYEIVDQILGTISIINEVDWDTIAEVFEEGKTNVIDTSEWETWTGEYLSAKLPEGWSAEEVEEDWYNEIYDKYLTQFLISDENGVILDVTVNQGWGGSCMWESYTAFEDDDPDRYQMWLDDAEMCEYDVNNYTELKSSDATAFTFLDNSVRRIDLNYYFDLDDDDDYFTVRCGVEPSTVKISDMSYFFDVELDNEGQILILDEVLKSLDLVSGDIKY